MLEIRVSDTLNVPSLATRGATVAGTPVIGGASPGDMLIVNDAGDAFDFFPAYPKRLSNLEYFGGNPNGVFQNDAVVNTMIAALNAGDRKMLEFPPGITLLSDDYAPTELIGGATSEYMTIRGMVGGYASRVQFEAGAGTASCLFKIGSAAEFALSLGISDMHVEFLNTPGNTEALFHALKYSELDIQNIQGNGVNKLFHGALGGRTTLRNWKIVPGLTSGAADSIIYLEDVAAQFLDGIVYGHAGVVANTDADGKIVHLKVGSGSASVDTVEIKNCVFQLYNAAAGFSAAARENGRPYGLYMEMPASMTGSLSNCWIIDNTFDHTSIAGIFLNRIALNNSYSADMQIRGNHVHASGGDGIKVLNSSTTGTKRLNAWDISHNNVVVREHNPTAAFGSALDLELGDGTARAINVADNILTDGNISTDVVPKHYAVRIGGSGWHLHDNFIDNQFNDAPGWHTGVKVTQATSKDFSAHDNFMPRVKREYELPVFAPSNIHRHIETSWDKLYRDRKWYTRTFDFDALTIPPEFVVFSGSNASAVDPVVSAGAAAGLLTMALGVDAGATMALNGSQINLANMMMFASSGGMFFECRLRATVASSLVIFAGFSDRVDALEMPFTITGGALASLASDACGLLIDTAATAPTWKGVGVKADTDSPTGILDSGVSLITGFVTLRMEIYEDETAVFYVNRTPLAVGGVPVDLEACLTNNTLVAPYIAAFNRNTAAKSVIVDRITFGCQRQVDG